MKELLTYSRQAAFKSCRRKCFYSYELGLRKIDDAKALRQGSAFHDGIEQLGNGKGMAAACEAVRSHYERCPVFIDPLEWGYEQETVLRVVCAYDWRWSSHPLEYLAVEVPFQLPLINPETGKRTTSFDLGGKIDAIVRLEDGRIAVKESKFLGEDIGPDAPLWRRLRMDQQISLYIHAARRLGYDASTVLYDTARKPTIAPGRVPILDELGAKIVLDAKGDRVKTERGMYRQTGDKERGYVLQERAMKADEWGDKLTADIGARPDFYFQRHEVARLDADLDEFQRELWDIQQLMRDAQKNKRWYRTVAKDTCQFCPYFGICESGAEVKHPPEGFEFITDKHPELLGAFSDSKGEPTHGSSSTPTETTPAPEAQRQPAELYW